VVDVRATASGGVYIEKPGTAKRYRERVAALAKQRPIRDMTSDEFMEFSRGERPAKTKSSPHERSDMRGSAAATPLPDVASLIRATTGYESAAYLENFLYFSRCGMIESVPRRRILSVS
jgi:hypothetical protein